MPIAPAAIAALTACTLSARVKPSVISATTASSSASFPAAAGAALNAFNKELLASHLRSCVANDIREGHDEVIDELVVTLQKLMK